MADNCPIEIFEYIFDFLHDDDIKSLKQYSLVSKSWIQLARRYLFAVVKFRTPDDIDKWKMTFPNLSRSPAYHTRTLFINCPSAITAQDASEYGWIPTFVRLSCLELDTYYMHFAIDRRRTFGDGFGISLALFRIYSPTLKTLRVSSPSLPQSQIFNLVHSLPFLEDLSLSGNDATANDEQPGEPQSTTPSPALTGTLEFSLFKGMACAARLLLSTPNGLHFHRLKLSWHEVEDIRSITNLVAACSGTLEYLEVSYNMKGSSYLVHQVGTPRSPGDPGKAIHQPVDLSTATKLKEVVLQCGTLTSGWIAATLRTIATHDQHRDLKLVSLHIPFAHHYAIERGRIVEETTKTMRWSDVDNLLVKLWELHRISSNAVAPRPHLDGMKNMAQELLPRTARRGTVHLDDALNSTLRLGPSLPSRKPDLFHGF